MYLSKAQVEGLSDIVGGEVTVMHPALVAFYLDNGLLVEELFGWRYSDKAGEWLAETRRENEQLQVDFSENKFTTGKRESWSNSDGPIVERKHKGMPNMSKKASVETKYKEIK
jgi:hypothetical protein